MARARLKRIGERISKDAKRVGRWVKGNLPSSRRKLLVIGGALVLVMGAAIASLVHFRHATPSAAVRAAMQRQMGDRQFAAGNRMGGLRAYERALALEPKSDDRMIANLVGCYGVHNEQPVAATLIVRYRLTAAAGPLELLTHSGARGARWGAVHTLDKLGLSRPSEYVDAWVSDLKAPQCDVRRSAVEKLGAHGDRKVVAALRAAKRRDKQETPWYRKSCLGSRPARAERQILARG
jgi:hypothetical protein